VRPMRNDCYWQFKPSLPPDFTWPKAVLQHQITAVASGMILP
jgi:hypothetical protein